jgi:hypothetical protein
LFETLKRELPFSYPFSPFFCIPILSGLGIVSAANTFPFPINADAVPEHPEL